MARVTFNTELCKGCGLCLEACPKKIVKIQHGKLNKQGFYPASVSEEDMELCIGCAMCATMCPDVVIRVER